MTHIKSISRSVLSAGLVLSSLAMAGMPFVARAEMLTRQLQLGMSGSDVSSLQAYLATDATIYPQGLVTGYFGSLTKSAVSNFQARNGIATVGRVGPVTLSLINQRMGNTDSMSPVISSLNVSTTNSTVSMNWNTNENASAVIYYSASQLSLQEGSQTSGVTVSGSSYLVHTDLRSSHSATLTGLNPNTVYHYVLYVRDSAGNENISWPATFVTNQ